MLIERYKEKITCGNVLFRKAFKVHDSAKMAWHDASNMADKKWVIKSVFSPITLLSTWICGLMK